MSRITDKYQKVHLDRLDLKKLNMIDIKNTNVFIDTETTGLDISNDTVFLFIFGFSDPYNVVFTIDINFDTKKDIRLFLEWIKDAPNVVFHNAKFDLHMLHNSNLEYTGNNVTDTAILARIVLPPDEESVALKTLAKMYIEVGADEEQKDLRLIKQNILTKNTKDLNNRLKEIGSKWKHTDIKKQLHTSEIGVHILPEPIKSVYCKWCSDLLLPYVDVFYEPTYRDVYREAKDVMLKYAYNDVIYTIEIYNKFILSLDKDLPLSKELNNVYNIEKAVLMPLYRQERMGWYIDKYYLISSAPKMKKLIESKRLILKRIAGFDLAPGQHKEIIEILKTKFFINPFPLNKNGKESIDKGMIDSFLLEKNQSPERKLFLQTIKELRTYEKWYTTNIIGFINRVNRTHDNIIRTQYNQSGTVTGRLSSDFQQMPKEAIFDDNGEEVFFPRKILKSRHEDFKLFFFDYSQMELRIQADYCHRLFPGLETNLLRAYVPYGYYSIITGKMYDLVNDVHNWDSGEWYLDNKPWEETDLHGLNAKTAFGDNLTEEQFTRLRKGGKTINFAANYGSSLKGLLSNVNLKEFNENEITMLYNAYKTNYPGVAQFSDYVKNQLKINGFVMNHFGKVYRTENTRFSFRYPNYLVQGTGAYVLKSSMIKIDKLLQDYKSRMIGSVHDELMFEIHKDEMFLVPKIKELMQDYPQFFIPMITDVEYSETNWAEKLDWKEE